MADRMHYALDAFDWATARRRLENAIRKSEAADRIDPAQARIILDERARKMAHRADEIDIARDRLTVLAFSVGAETYVLETCFVREIARVGHLLDLPGTPSFVVGTAKLRGEIHAVFDLGAMAGLPPAIPTENSRIVVVGQERIEFGLIADEIRDLTTLSRADLLAPMEREDGGRAGLFQGTTADAALLIDGTALIGNPNLFIGMRSDQGAEGDHGTRI